MSEPNIVQDFLSAEGNDSGREHSLSTTAIAPTEAAQQLELSAVLGEPSLAEPEIAPMLASPSTSETISADQHHSWEQEHACLVAELMQTQSIAHGQVERIRQLEQALDQSLASLDELRLQIVDQQLLEKQLATTEEISNIQQQAIARLKLQLAQQQQALETQLTETQARDHTLQELLTTLELLTHGQQTELEQLRAQITQDRREVQAYQHQLEQQLADLQFAFSTQQQRSTEIESQSLSAHVLAESLEQRLEQAQTQVRDLSQNLSDRQVALDQLETELRQAHTALQEQQALIDTLLQQVRTPSPTTAVSPDSASGRVKSEESDQLLKLSTTHAMLQHACQELEEERDRQTARIVELENQTADMQEQILRQAQQAIEYEAAVQHWKDRYFTHQSQVLRLKELLEALPDPSPELLDVLGTLQATVFDPEPSSPTLRTALPADNGPKIDLPDFLVRRRNYKTRRS